MTRSKGSHALEAYWKSIRPAGGVPSRGDIDLSHIPDLLANIVLIDVYPEPDRKLIVRLAGTNLLDLWKFEPKGKDYLNFIPDDQKDEVYNGFVEVGRRPCGRWRQVISNYAAGGSVRVETTMLPLQGAGPGQSMVIVYLDVMTEQHLIQGKGETILASFPVRARWIDLGHGVPE